MPIEQLDPEDKELILALSQIISIDGGANSLDDLLDKLGCENFSFKNRKENEEKIKKIVSGVKK